VKPLLLAFALAHDLWIEPSSFRPQVGESVAAALRVGTQLQGEPVPRIPPLVERFTLGDAPMLGMPGSDPAGVARVAAPGLQWIGYQSKAFPVTLDEAAFETYMREEGLRVKARRKGEQRERFYRCAKALIDVGRASARPDGLKPVLHEPLGFTLELIPQKIPARGKLPLTLLFRGKPAADILVVAMSRSDPDKAVSARTDAKGRVTLPIAHGGFWLIKAVHMQPAPPDAGVDWESWWASLTFEL
jgi:uncharacterized GH25 family protein